MAILYLRWLVGLLLLTYTQCKLTSDERDMMLVALTDVKHETINQDVILETGTIPAWLKGNFVRHACSVFGETDAMNDAPLNYIQHLFDCVPMLTKFRLENGNVTFTNKRYDINEEDCYNRASRNMNVSGVFTEFGVFSQRNMSAVKECDDSNVFNKTTDVPHVSWWQIGNEAIAMTESPVGVIVDPERAEQKGHIQYNDNNMGYGNDVMFSNNPAHEQTEADGTLWSTATAIKFVPNSPFMKQWRVVYKVGRDKIRHVVGEFKYPDVDMRRCSRTPPFNVYPDVDGRFGYMHSFVMTPNYVILPETAYMFNPCFYAHYNPSQPFFPSAFQYEPTQYSRLLVMDRATGTFIANLTVRPFFVTHQLGAYEDGDVIHMDMLMYNDSSVYTKTTFVKEMLTENAYATDVMRISINTTSHDTTITDLRRGRKPMAIEFSNINYAYYGQKYKYAYMVKNWARVTDLNTITKLNVDTGDEIDYVFTAGMLPQEPQFIPRPNPTSEDDGVLLSQGIDTKKKKAFMVILDAKTMNLIGHVTAPDISLIGIHDRFFGLEVGQQHDGFMGIVGKK